MTKMTDSAFERQNGGKSWFQTQKENAVFQQKKKDARKKGRSILEEENERLRALIDLSRRGNR